MDTLKDLVVRVIKFRDDRAFGPFHTAAKLAISISIEAAELLEHFQWSDGRNKEEVAEEMADVMIYLLDLSDVLNVDMYTTVIDKIAKNEIKYPLGANDENS